MQTRELICPMCFYKASSNRTLMRHCLIKHQHEGSNFIAVCTVNGCYYSSRSWKGFKQHCKRKHSHINVESCLRGSFPAADDGATDTDAGAAVARLGQDAATERIQYSHDPEVDDSSSFQHLLCKFFLSMEIDHKVSRTALNMLAGVTGHLLNSVANQVVRELWNQGLMRRDIGITDWQESVSDTTQRNFMDFLDNFLTTNERQKFYQTLPTYVRPEKIRLGCKNIRQRNGFALKQVYGYYVPLRKQLQLLLRMPEVVHYLRNPILSTDELMRDIEDTPIAKEINSQHPGKIVLKFSLSYDDLHLTNPLRGISRYKLAMIYFTLLNIPVSLRSRLKCIFLVGIARTDDLHQYGIEPLLRDFVTTINVLSTQGLTFEVGPTEITVMGKLLYACCDNPAANLLGGFKLAAGLSKKACRRCYADQQSMRRHFNAKRFRLRNMQQYLDECSTLSDRNLSQQNVQYWSKVYGVNEKSCLTSIENFSVTSDLIQDPLHVLLEGICPHLLALFLNKVVIQDEYLSLQDLNGYIASYPYEQSDKTHLPEPIQRRHITVDNNVRQKGSAMLLLCIILPHILGSKLPPDMPHYRHFIYLIQILQLSFAPYCDMDTAGELEVLIELFGQQWNELYPGSRSRPKLHFLTHFVEMMKKFGSLQPLNAIRFEGKHFFFKDFRWKNYTNLPYSLAEKHCLFVAHTCMNANGTYNSNFLQSADVVGEGETVKISEHHLVLHDYIEKKYGFQDNFECYETSVIGILGLQYKIGSILLVDWDDMMNPTFGVIERLIVYEEEKLALVTLFKATSYEWRWHSYLVEYTREEVAISLKKLRNPFPLSLYRENEKLLVMNKFAHFSGQF